jgi:hypothetical protein
MTSSSFRLAAVGAALYLAAVASSAEAAKGVKKVGQVNGQRTITGEVIAVNHQKGTFHVRTAHHHKKLGAGNGGNVAKPANAPNAAGGKRHHHGDEFNVNSATRFEHHGGGAASLASLHQGERVRVRAVGHQAENVHILSHAHSRGNFQRHRPNRYHPPYHHHRRRF